MARPRTVPCGEYQAYKRHLRNGEDPCDACKAANTRRTAERRRRRAVEAAAKLEAETGISVDGEPVDRCAVCGGLNPGDSSHARCM